MAVTRIKNNQITDATIVASSKLTDYSISAAKIANNLTYGSNLTIAGNLTVQGNTTAIDTNITTIEDPVILLASTQTGSPAVDIGFIGQRGTSTNIAFVWDESQGLFVAAFTDTAETATTINVTAYASVKVLNAEATGNLAVTGNANVTGKLAVTGQSNIANLTVAANSVVSFGNVVISNVGTPLANADAATKSYVDNATGNAAFFISSGNVTETITPGDDIVFAGTTNQTTVVLAAIDGNSSSVTIGLANNVSTVGNVTVGANLGVTGAVVSNLIPGTTATYNLGNATNTWKDLYLAGNSIYIDVQSIAANATGVQISNTITGGNVVTGGIVSATGNVTGGNINTVAGVYSATVSASGTATVGNVATGGTVSATGNVTGGNVKTAGLISATGDINGGNIYTGGEASVTGNVTGGNVTTAGAIRGATVSATGNITGGNITTAGIANLTTIQSSTISASGTATVGNVATAGTVSATGTGTFGNVATGGTVSATGTGTFGNVATAGTASAAGTVTGGNVATGGTVSATGNITGGNITTAGTANLTTIQSTTISASGTATVGNVATGGTVSATGNITGGNVATGGIVNATGTVTGGNINTAGNVSATGTVTGGATGTFGNVATAGYVSATGNINGGNIIANAGFQSPSVVITSTTANAGISLVTNGTGNINVNTSFINNVKDPLQAQDAATKGYVDAVVEGLDPKASVHAATTTALPAYTYNNGTSGVGATITGNAVGNLVMDGQTILSGQRVLIKDETAGNAPYNGIYLCTTQGTAGVAYVLTRAADFNAAIEMYGAFTFVETGTIYADTGWICTNNLANPITVGTTAITWSQFSGAGQYTAGNALTLNGTQFNVNTDLSANATIGINGSNQLIVPASAIFTTPNIGAATGTSLSASGNVVGGNVLTSGLVSATATGTFGNVATGGTVSATGTGTFGNISTAGAVTSATVSATGNITGGNITTAGTANLTTIQSTTISASGTATVGNVATGGTVSATGTGTFGNVATGGTVSATGTATVGNVATAGTVSAAGTATVGNVATGGTVSATGNVTGGNITTAGTANLTTIQSTTISATGTATVGNVSTVGFVTATGNVTGGNVLTAGRISATGDVNGGNIYTTGEVSATGTGTFGNISTAGAISSATVSATGNITGGNITTAGIANLTTIQSSTVSATGTATVGNLATGGTVSATGNITGGNIATSGAGGAISGSGNITGGNILTGGQVSATGNITGGNIATSGTFQAASLSATGNITGGNITTAGIANLTTIQSSTVSASGNVNGGNLISAALVQGVTVSASGNVIGGNVTTAGLISATGNITGGNVIATSGKFGNIVISGDDITDTNGIVNINSAGADVNFAVNGDTVANLLFVDAGTSTVSIGSATQTTGAILALNATSSFLPPVGNTAQRPTGVVGMIRYNTSINALEIYDNTGWTAVAAPEFTVIVDNQFNGDGANTAFTLTQSSTTAGSIVTLNGVQQIPVTAYAVSGTTLTFTEAPAVGDVIDVRIFTTTTSVGSISNSGNTAVVAVSEVAANVLVTGNLVVAGPGVFVGDGSGLTNLNVSGNSISSGTSKVDIASLNGNARTVIAGSTIVTVSPGLVDIQGNLTVSGNATLSGNILGDRIQNGTTSFDIQSASGNANITIGGTSNVAVFSPTIVTLAANLLPSANITYDLGTTTQRWKDLYLANSTIYLGNSTISANATAIIMTNPAGGQTVLAGASGATAVTGATVSATGTITGGNIATGGTVSATGNITGGNLTVGTGTITGGNIVNSNANGIGNIGSSTTYFNTVFAKATSAQYADLAEKYAADAEYTPGTVVSFGGSAEVTASADADSRVAGVISTNPSYIMNGGLQAEHVATVALTGRVPTRVTGTVRKGDLMVSAGNGLARAEQVPAPGTIIGKALADHDGAEGTIEVVVGRF